MIYYLGYYSCDLIAQEKRSASPPAKNKMGYVISALSTIKDEKTVVVSPSETSCSHFVRGTENKINESVSIKTFLSLGSRFWVIRCFGHLLTRMCLYHFLLTRVKSDDILLVYHSLALMNIVQMVKRRTRCKLVLEVEEIYADVKENDKLREKEVDYLQEADAYIVITESVNNAINPQKKKSIISHGSYQVSEKCGTKFQDGKVHVVYAGTFNPIKGGVYAAIEAAEFLDENYVLHVLGKGSREETDNVIRKINQVSDNTKCKIIYEGYRSGKAFDGFIQACDVGLSTQQPNGKYNASSFPSKILMYMTNGLPVVSVKIPAVETSHVGEFVFYYSEPTPQKIAEAIRMVPAANEMSIVQKLNELDGTFKRELCELIK